MKKRRLPPSARAMEYAGLMKVVPFASERLRFVSLRDAWLAGWRAAKSEARRAHNGTREP